MLKYIVLLLLAGLVVAQPVKYTFSDDNERNQATFSSETPLEDVYGTADAVSGFAEVDMANLAESLKGEILIKVKSLKTGIDLRDEHLYSANWLDEETYPEIKYVIKSLSDVKETGKGKYSGKVAGEFHMHGKSKPVHAMVELTFVEGSEKTKSLGNGNLLVVKAKFDVKLSDYGVQNDVVGSKVAENIAVEFSGIGSSK